MIHPFLLCLLVLFSWLGVAWGAETPMGAITPSEVYSQAEWILRETEEILRHFRPDLGQTALPQPPQPVTIELEPRHVWQKSYMVLVKINLFLRQHGSSGISPVVLDPTLHLEPRQNWAQTQRILTEIRILKRFFGIAGEVPPPTITSHQRPLEVFNKLDEVSRQWDAINRTEIRPAQVYAEVSRVNEDIDEIMRRLQIPNTAAPPAKKAEANSGDSLRQALQLMGEVQRLQHLARQATIDFRAMFNPDVATPDQVFTMVGMVLAEIQPIKVLLGMTFRITPPADYQEDKSSADVEQLLGYVTHKVRLIQALQ